jgi:hypothetical protein
VRTTAPIRRHTVTLVASGGALGQWIPDVEIVCRDYPERRARLPVAPAWIRTAAVMDLRG